MFYLIYKITNKIDGKFYIGSHKTDNLNDNYMGSGKYLKYAQEKYGIENFEKEILYIFETPEEMYTKEAEIVNEDFLVTENTYNLKVGGFGGWDFINANSLNGFSNKEIAIKGAITTNKIRTQIHSEKLKTDKEYRQKYSEAVSKGLKEYYKNATDIVNGMNGKRHSEESKAKMRDSHIGNSNSQYGTMWITNGIENKKIMKDDHIPEGWNKGRKIKLVR